MQKILRDGIKIRKLSEDIRDTNLNFLDTEILFENFF